MGCFLWGRGRRQWGRQSWSDVGESLSEVLWEFRGVISFCISSSESLMESYMFYDSILSHTIYYILYIITCTIRVTDYYTN